MNANTSYAPPETPTAKEYKIIVGLSLLLNAVYLAPVLFIGIGNLGQFDSDPTFFYIEAVRRTIMDYGQFPGWDPWHMGGMPLIGSPHTPFSPFYFPVFIFGTVIGAKMALFLMHVVGFGGTWLLGRRLGLQMAPALAAASVWSFSGMHAVQIQAGWLLFSHIHLYPWIFLIYISWRNDLYKTPIMALVLSLTLLGGSAHTIPVIFLPLGAMGLYWLVVERNPRPLAFFVVSVLLFTLLCMFKVIPTYLWVTSNPRNFEGLVEGYSAAALFWSLFDHTIELYSNPSRLFSTGIKFGTMIYPAPEFGFYAGIAALFAVAGVFERFLHRGVLLFAFFVLLLVVMDAYAPIPLWSLLKKFPVYEAMRVPMRFRWALLLIFALLAGFGVKKLSSLFADRGKAVAAAAFVVVALNLIFASWPILYNSFRVPPEKAQAPVQSTGAYFQVWESGWYDEQGWTDTSFFGQVSIFPYILKNIGVTLGPEALNLRIYSRGRGAPDYHGEAFLHTPDGFREASIVEWSPNRVSIVWEKGVRGDLYLNQNYFPDWNVCGPEKLSVVPKRLVRVPITERDGSVTLCYRAPYAYAGIIISVLSLLACVVFIFKNSRFK